MSRAIGRVELVNGAPVLIFDDELAALRLVGERVTVTDEPDRIALDEELNEVERRDALIRERRR